jgi:hypothetical protein
MVPHRLGYRETGIIPYAFDLRVSQLLCWSATVKEGHDGYRLCARIARAISSLAAAPALAQKSGAREFFYRDSPASGSIR